MFWFWFFCFLVLFCFVFVFVLFCFLAFLYCPGHPAQKWYFLEWVESSLIDQYLRKLITQYYGSHRGNSSTEVPSSLIILACIKQKEQVSTGLLSKVLYYIKNSKTLTLRKQITQSKTGVQT